MARRFDFHQEVPHGGVAWRHFARAACFPFLLQFLILGAVTGGNIPSRPSLPWCVVPKRCGPEVMAALRNAAIGLLRTMGVTNIAEALRRNASQVGVLFTKLGILKQ